MNESKQQVSSTAKHLTLNQNLIQAGSYLSKGIEIPDKEILMNMPFNERVIFLTAKAERDFLNYYGEDGEHIISAVEKEKDEFLLMDIPRYAMYMPSSAYGVPKDVLENRARSLFKKSAYLLETIEDLKSYLENGNSIDDQTKEKVENYIKNLHDRALKLVKSKFSVHQKQNEGTLWYLAQTKSIEKDLEISDEELFLNLYWFKFAKTKEPPPSVEDIIGHSINLLPSKELSEEEQTEIISIYEDNWKQENQETKNALIKNLKESFGSSPNELGSEFVVIRNHKEIVGFVRFEDKGSYEFASALNIRENYKKFGLAEALLDASLKSRSSIHPVHARARLSLGYTQKYIEKFDATGVSIENYNDTLHLNLIFSQEEKQKFITKNLSLQEIENLKNENIQITQVKDLQELSLPENFSLVRVISNPQGGIYCILEKIN